jgi:tetratricopeptide (TPR) repeat protein
MNMAVLVRWLRGALLGCGFCLTTLSALATPTDQVQTPYGFFPLGEISPFPQDIPFNAPKLGRSVSLPPLLDFSTLSQDNLESLMFSFFDRESQYFKTTLESFQKGDFAPARDRFYNIIVNRPNSYWAKLSEFWLGLSRAQLKNADRKGAVDDLQGWLKTDVGQMPRLRSAAYLTLTWLTAELEDCVGSQVWLSRLRDVGKASREYLREGTRIELYCAAQTKPAQVPAIFDQLRQDPGNPQNLVRFVAEEASYQYERANCNPILRLREEYFEKYYLSPEMGDLAVMSAWCRWRQQDWETLRQEVQTLVKRGILDKDREAFRRKEDQLSLLQLELALRKQDEKEISQAMNALRQRELRRESAYRVMWQSATWGWWKFLLDFPLPVKEFALRSRVEEFRLLRAQALQATGESEPARQIYEEILVSPDLAISLKGEAIYRLAYLDLAEGQAERGLERCQQVTQEFVESARLGDCYFWQAALEDPKRNENQRRAIGLTLRQVPADAGREEEKALIRIGLSMLNEEWLEAQKEAKTLVDEEPPSHYQVRAWQWLVAIYRGLELPGEALRELDALLKAHPDALNKDLLIEQVLLLRDLNRREEALQVLLSHPQILDLEMQQLQLSLLWELELWEGFLEKALQMLLQMQDPKDQAELHFRRGQAYEQINDPLKALPAYERSLQNVLNPTWEIEAKLAILGLYHGLKDVRFTERSEIYLKDTRFKPEQEEQIRNWLVERYEYVGEPTRTIPHRQSLIRLWEDRLRNNLESDPAARELQMLGIGRENSNLGRLGAPGAWEQAESWSAQLRRSENPLIQRKALLLGGEAAAALQAHERSVAAYLQLTYFHAEGLNENQKFKAWQQMGRSYEALERINDAKAIYSKISNELSDPQMKQAAANALQRLKDK